jgi:hypothetical protein
MQRLTSIIDQIKAKSRQVVVSVLATLARLPFSALPSSHMSHKGTLVDLVRRWKNIDSSVTEAANEVRGGCAGMCWDVLGAATILFLPPPSPTTQSPASEPNAGASVVTTLHGVHVTVWWC